LRRSVALDKQNAAAWNNLGLMLRRKGDAAGAQEAFANAAEIRRAEEREKEKQLQRGMARNPPLSH
jgi:Flp pilus assembly protein TadD